MNRYANTRAFTLLELIITLAIAAILLAIATPSFTNFTQKRAVSQKTVQVRSALELARGLAVSQHQSLEGVHGERSRCLRQRGWCAPVGVSR